MKAKATTTDWLRLSALLGVPLLLGGLIAGCSDPESELCDGVTCSDHGRCVVEGGQALCDCDSGFYPGGSLTCLPPGDGDADVDGDGDADPDWTVDMVPGENIGRFSSIDVAPDGTVGVAYYSYVPYEDGICEEILQDPPTRLRWPILFSELAPGAADWTTETVTNPLHLDAPSGLSFRYSPSGVPTIAVYSGEPEDTLCAANDVVLFSRAGGAWTSETAVGGSAEAAAVDNEAIACSAAASNAGFCVGQWPALGFDRDGNPAILYRDTHFGGKQHDDTYRSDTELAYRVGGWLHEMVDCGAGGGVDNAVAFDTSNRFVGLQRITREDSIDSRHGVWAHRRQGDGTWLALRLARGLVQLGERSLSAGANDSVVAIYYDPTEQHPFVAELVDTVRFADGGSWVQTNIGNNSFNEGQNPAVAVSPNGDLAVAYYRCNRVGEATCSPAQDALIFGWRHEGVWQFETVDEGGAGFCGTEISLAVGPDGDAHISYVCARHVSGDQFVNELKVATRRAP